MLWSCLASAGPNRNHRLGWHMKEQANFKRGWGRALLVSSLLLPTAGCDNLLTVDTPGEILAENLESPSNAPLLTRSALSSFECAFGAYIMAAGTLGQELIEAGLSSSTWPVEQRTVNDQSPYGSDSGCDEPAIYVPLSTARWSADNLLEKLTGEWSSEEYPDRADMIGTLGAVSGYSLTLLGEGMCSAALDLGPEMFPSDFFTEAVERFQIGLAAGASPELTNWNRVGLGRALLNLGDAQAAADAVRDVPEDFIFSTTHSNTTASRRNPAYRQVVVNGDPVVDGTHYFGLTFDGVPDPRVPVTDPGDEKGSDNLVPWWRHTKYTSESSPLPVARWAEAQLIIAEAEGGQTAVDIINDLHARAGLPPYDPGVHTTPGPSDEITNHIIQERRREFFLESHHLGDFRRYDLPLDPAPGEPYPWTGGGFYGDARCFPVPFSERASNPNFS